ncbi:MAG: LLM class flavin-dependent oxidoreductase [Hyphomonadaceae bacterium]|nr:LLM class flavin-dependent oxidoreductase [Hyphomonadaceae bacterium]
MIPFSVLDLAPVVEGADVAQALSNSRDLAQNAERLGYRRFWLAEHHAMPGIASAATALTIMNAAAATNTIRVGAGGIMLPNHAPIIIAEQFGTLEALFPGRIDLGVGRAPGGDRVTMQALRRTLIGGEDRFPQDVLELQALLGPSAPGQVLRAVPGEGSNVPIWILGSSTFGAQLAGLLGLPFAFASHFAPAQMMEALAVYRGRFKPSEQLKEPYVMLGFNTFAAPTDEEGRLLSTSLMQAFASLRRGEPRRLQPPDPEFEQSLSVSERASLEAVLACSAIGSPRTVRRSLEAFIRRTGADELIIASHIFDHAARVRAYEITAQVRDELAAA